MLSLKEKMEDYNFTERQVCTILDNYMYNLRLEEYLKEEVERLKDCIHITEKKMYGYKKMFSDGVEYYNASAILSNIQHLEAEKEEYILKQSTLVNLLNEFREYESEVI